MSELWYGHHLKNQSDNKFKFGTGIPKNLSQKNIKTES